MAEVVHANRTKVASESNGERNERAMTGGWVGMMSCRVPLAALAAKSDHTQNPTWCNEEFGIVR